MSSETETMGVHKPQRKYKAGAMTIFFAIVALVAGGLATWITADSPIDKGAIDSGSIIVFAAESTISSMLAMPVVLFSFFFAGLAILISLFRLRHVTRSKKVLINIVAIVIACAAIYLSAVVYLSLVKLN